MLEKALNNTTTLKVGTVIYTKFRPEKVKKFLYLFLGSLWWLVSQKTK